MVLKEQQVLGGKFDKNNYIEERATAQDGTKFQSLWFIERYMEKNGENRYCYTHTAAGHGCIFRLLDCRF
jgi:oligopeptidase B